MAVYKIKSDHKYICRDLTSEGGNALFLILIAVALFAALSYAVTQSGRGGAGIDREREILDDAVNEQCIGAVEAGVMRLRIIGQCRTGEISYELADGTNTNPNAPLSRTCHVFDSAGAGVTPCGDYLDPLVETGQIAYGDTTTIALLASGTYLRCNSFLEQTASYGACNLPQLSIDGSNFMDVEDICQYPGFDFDEDDLGGLNDAICAAACGGGSTGYTSGPRTGPFDYIISPSHVVSPHSGACPQGARSLVNLRCNCWSS